MRKTTLRDIALATGGKVIRGSEETAVETVVHDSRQVKAGDLFVALIGARRDAHDFLPQVAEAGCNAVMISREDAIPSEWTGERPAAVLVEDTEKALQRLAAWYIKEIGATVIGVTGSTGKTTTKDMVEAVCRQKYVTGKTEGNFNSDIGLPLTILGFDEDVQVAVLEMGMDHAGEIEALADLARPRIGLITNIGISHMENLGSREGIFQAKMELTRFFDEESTLIITTGEDFLRRENIHGDFAVVTAGEEAEDDYRILSIQDTDDDGLSFTVAHGETRQNIHLPLPGRHNAGNATMAIAAGACLGVPMEQAATGLEAMRPTEGRLTLKRNGQRTVIDDTYNASPDSVRGALGVLAHRKERPRIAILGDMLELGEGTEARHEEMGRLAAESCEKVYAVGEMARFIAEGAGTRGEHFSTREEFTEDRLQGIPENAVVLVKGSRGMHMEEIVAALMKKAGRTE